MPPSSSSACSAASSRSASCPGLTKLGIDHLPPAVAAAQYHYLSNWIGGVHVEYMYESDRKAWIRYPPPRWIWKGTAICGIPGEVSRAMLRGWHANNGVALGDLRLGFVCTKQSVDGQDGLEGYYYRIRPSARARCSGWCSRAISKRRCSIPRKRRRCRSTSWPRPRLEKAYRNYAMEYVKTAAPVMVQLFGPEEARSSAASHRQADRHAVFRRGRAGACRGPRRREGVCRVPARAVRDAGRRRRDQQVRGPVRDHASRAGS